MSGSRACQAAALVLAAAMATALTGPVDAQVRKPPKTPLEVAKERVASGKIRQKVIFGTPAAPGAYPFQVSMVLAATKKGKEFDGHICGGTFLSPTWILTAAHCVTEGSSVASEKDFEVLAGTQDFRGGERIPVKKVFRHPKYDDDFTENDIALLQLVRAPKAGTKYKTVDLVDAATEAALTGAGAPVTVIGWGQTEKDEGSQVLLQAPLKIAERGECNTNFVNYRSTQIRDGDATGGLEFDFRIPESKWKAFREAVTALVLENAGTIVTDSMICAGEPNPGGTAERLKSPCYGDSGGPLLAKAPNGAFVQVGIVSWGAPGCGVPTVQAVFSRLGRLAEWAKTTAR
jgi:secreted trypsin-like serine protease